MTLLHKQMITKTLPRETLEIAASIKLRVEKYYEQLDKQVFERSNRQESNVVLVSIVF